MPLVSRLNNFKIVIPTASQSVGDFLALGQEMVNGQGATKNPVPDFLTLGQEIKDKHLSGLANEIRSRQPAPLRPTSNSEQ